jgi:hypothetical protein
LTDGFRRQHSCLGRNTGDRHLALAVPLHYGRPQRTLHTTVEFDEAHPRAGHAVSLRLEEQPLAPALSLEQGPVLLAVAAPALSRDQHRRRAQLAPPVHSSKPSPALAGTRGRVEELELAAALDALAVGVHKGARGTYAAFLLWTVDLAVGAGNAISVVEEVPALAALALAVPADPEALLADALAPALDVLRVLAALNLALAAVVVEHARVGALHAAGAERGVALRTLALAVAAHVGRRHAARNRGAAPTAGAARRRRDAGAT